MKKVIFLLVFTTVSLCALAQLTINEQPKDKVQALPNLWSIVKCVI